MSCDSLRLNAHGVSTFGCRDMSCQAHFEESMAHSRKSVSEEELARYDSFSTNMKSDRGFEEFSFDDNDGAKDGANDMDDVDDLYG